MIHTNFLLIQLLETLNPELNNGVYVFASVPLDTDITFIPAIATFHEREGLTLIFEEEIARSHGLIILFRAAWITLMVHSELEAVGLTAAVSAALASENIRCPLRELTALSETGGQEWAKALRSLLSQMHQAVVKAKGADCLPALHEARFEEEYRRLLKIGGKANPPPLAPAVKRRGKVKQTPARNLLTRLEQGQEAVLRFLHDFTVPFDNTLAQRDVRMMKVKQKVSGCFRAFSGAEGFCLIRSYVSTLRKQGQSLLAARRHVCEGNPLQPQLHAFQVTLGEK